jgi:cellobiose phosphorylase
MYQYGHFNEDGTEFIITNPKTPRAFDNFLWNDSLFSSVHQTGVGFIDYQIGDREGVQLLTGIGRICDFDVFGREGLMSRLIYIRDNETGEFWNVNWEPVKKKYETYKCTHGLGYSIISTRVNKLEADFRIFVPKGSDPVELWTLGLNNTDSRQKDYSVFVYNQFQFSYKWGFNSYGDMLFRSSKFNKEDNAVLAIKQPHISPHSFQTAFFTADRQIDAWDGSRDFFVGAYNQLNEPEGVIRGFCSNTPGSSDSTVGVAQFNIHLEAGAECTIEMILGITDSEKNIAAIKARYLNKSDAFFTSLKAENKRFVWKNAITTPDEHLNRLLNIWIKHQTSYGARWCRWGWMGYRDIVQHGYGVSSFDPLRTREILLEALKYQYSSGMALRGWNPVDEKPYSDSALWLVFTLISYLKETGDFGFLELTVPYYDSGEATVLNHIETALSFLEQNKGSHNLCLIKYGDWNDSLTGVGKEGRGESVWLSMAYAEALRLMEELFTGLKDADKTEQYGNRYKSVKLALNTEAWDGEWYRRCYDDNGKPVGSSENSEGKIFLNTQSWSLISGIADPEKQVKLIRSSNQMLLTPMGYKLLAPTFFNFDPDIGRISCLQPGICENGTVYSHVNVWMILGLLRAGFPDMAYDIFKRITPGYPGTITPDPKQNMPPYIYANGYYGPDHKNNKYQMEFTWITGSVAWYYNVLSKEMTGIQPEFGGLRIAPVIPSDWNEIKAVRNFRNKLFNITIKRGNVDRVTVFHNGKKLGDNLIPLIDFLPVNEVEVMIPSSH